MQLYIAQGGQQRGPFPLEQVQEMVRRGEVSLYDLAWHEGAADWKPLSTILGPAPLAAAPPPPGSARTPGIGLASFIVGAVGIVVMFVIIACAGAASTSGTRPTQDFYTVIGLLILFCGLGNVVGVILGVIALANRGSKKVFSAIGVSLNGLQILGIIFLMLLGLSQTH